MIDTHAHLDFPEYDKNREEVIARFFESGGKAIINVGIDLDASKRSIEIAESHKNIFSSVGLHPNCFNDQRSMINDQNNWIEELNNLAKNSKVVAIGETGLDYYHITHNMEHETRDLKIIKNNQKDGFMEQIAIARELDLPVIVHCREAWDDVFEIVSQKSKSKIKITKFVLHCYSGDKTVTEKFLKLSNVYFSFSGNITFPKPKDKAKQFQEVIGMVPLDKIMLDSDSPFLAPQDVRGKMNEPENIRYISERIAQIKDISGDEVEQATDQNAKTFFAI